MAPDGTCIPQHVCCSTCGKRQGRSGNVGQASAAHHRAEHHSSNNVGRGTARTHASYNDDSRTETRSTFHCPCMLRAGCIPEPRCCDPGPFAPLHIWMAGTGLSSSGLRVTLTLARALPSTTAVRRANSGTLALRSVETRTWRYWCTQCTCPVCRHAIDPLTDPWWQPASPCHHTGATLR
jgi:hypothetical protein